MHPFHWLWPLWHQSSITWYCPSDVIFYKEITSITGKNNHPCRIPWSAMPDQLIKLIPNDPYNFSAWEVLCETAIITWRHAQNGWHFPNNIFKCILLNENYDNFLKILLNFFNYNKPAPILTWLQAGNKSLPVPMLAEFAAFKYHQASMS